MKRYIKKLCMAATAFAMGIATASASMGATPESRDEPASHVAEQFGVAVRTVLDELEGGHAGRPPLFPTLPAAPDLADSTRILATGGGTKDPLAMTIASLGLMTIIAYRRLIR